MNKFYLVLFGALLLLVPLFVISEITINKMAQTSKDLFDQSTQNLQPAWLLVLGAGNNSESPILNDRIVNAWEASKKFPHAKVILSGNDDVGEVNAMDSALAKLGLDPARVILDPTAKKTWDSFQNLKLFKFDSQPGYFVTNEFHQRRSQAIAGAFKIPARAYGKDLKSYGDSFYLSIRERFATIKFLGLALFKK